MIVIKELHPLDHYRLRLRFADGTEGTLDLSHLAGEGVFAFWKDDDNFKKVYMDEVSGAIAWNEYPQHNFL